MHPDTDLSVRNGVHIPNTWPDGELAYFEDFESPADIPLAGKDFIDGYPREDPPGTVI